MSAAERAGGDLVRPLWTEALDPLFWPASRAGTPSAWVTHVPFAHWIVAAARPRSIVELGAYNGVSYSAFCEAVQRAKLDCRCLAVDTWQGDEHAGFYGEEIYAELRGFHDLRYAGFSELMRCTFDAALDYVPDGSIDLLHIDGLHTYDAVRHDFDSWTPKLSERAVVLFHDTNVRERGFGVWRLWAELAQRYPSFEFLHGHGLGVLAVGAAASDGVRSLALLADTTANAVRERFAFLGERWQGEVRVAASRAGQSAQQHEHELRAAALESEVARAQAGVARAQAGFEAAVAQAREMAAAQAEDERRQRGRAEAAEAALAHVAADLATAQAEAGGLRADLGAAQTELAVVQRSAAAALGAAQAEAADARSRADALAAAAAEAERAGAERAGAERAQATAAAAALRRALETARSEHQAILSSTAWRATALLRRGVRALPPPLRRAARSGPRVLWWAATLQLPRRLRARQDAAAQAALVAASPLFDAGWYDASNPDVAGSGIPPALHYAWRGGPEGRDPGPDFQVRAYLDRHPQAASEPGGAFLHALAHGSEQDGRPLLRLAEPSASPEAPHPPAAPAEIPPTGRTMAPEPDEAAAKEPPLTAGVLLARRFPALAALPVYAAPNAGGRRLTVVTDSINTGSLYGGVGTALILAALTARRVGAGLRLVTRTEPPDVANVGEVLSTHGVPWSGNIDFVHAPSSPAGRDVPTAPDDLFLTTSWWTTWATRQSVPRASIAYLLQEDERMFYPLGDDHLRCAETLADPSLLYIVNSHLLHDHMAAEGLAPHATAFEPAFPKSAPLAKQAQLLGGKRNFFFYARPNNARNLYFRGLEALCGAIEEGVLDPAEWDFHFAGHGAEPLSLPRGARALFPGPMPWPDYLAFVRRMELGLCLMYTPHPSYPPLDLASSGAVVVTNRFGVKRDLDRYSRNILCADPDVRSLVAALRAGKALAADRPACLANFAQNRFETDWAVSMAPALDRLAAWAGA